MVKLSYSEIVRKGKRGGELAQTIAGRIKALQQMPVARLREEYRKVYGKETTAANKGFLLKKVAWRIQELEFGGIPEEVRQKAVEIVRELDLPGRIPSAKLKEQRTIRMESPFSDNRLPMPGAIINREYNGQVITVEVLAEGFMYNNMVYKSLSAVAKAVTGSHWNGFTFFKLGPRKKHE